MNRSAFATRWTWSGAIRETFTVRNTFTERSLRVEQAKGSNLESLQAKVGSLADYMQAREEGETKRPKAGKHVPIPSVLGARGGRKENLIRRPNKVGSITLLSRSGKTKAQRNAISIRQAKETGSKHAFLEGNQGGAIVKVGGGKRRTKLRTVWNLTRPSVLVRPMPTLEPTLERLGPTYVDIHVRAVREQLTRNKVLGF